MNQHKLLWQPNISQIEKSALSTFRSKINSKFGLNLLNSDDLHQWSIANIELFWSYVWDEAKIIGEKGNIILQNPTAMPGAQFFPQAKLNYAQNMLKKFGHETAIISYSEDQRKIIWSWDDLQENVGKAQQYFLSLGLQKGDRVAAIVPNIAQTMALMLAATSLGLIWSSCSPDFGTRGILDRFSQIEPKILIACDGYWYNSKTLDIREKLSQVAQELKSLKAIVIIDQLGLAIDKNALPVPAQIYSQLPLAQTPTQFVQVEFNHPLFIMFSSGTTGIPKCIVHGHGGTLLQHWKEHALHCNIQPNDKVFYFSTCGWMMWNWLASVLALGATAVLFDGSPFAVKPDFLWDIAQNEQLSFFGTSAKYIDACHKEGLKPLQTHNLSHLRTITSTGSPLSPESFEYIYSSVKSEVHLASISGGTDIVSCFVLGDPTKPVYCGEIQCAGLGMAVDVFDDEGKPAGLEKGELVCTKPFPSMPVGFWNDADGQKYHSAYFERFMNIWCHGDFAQKTNHGGLIIHGRSDATLNPGGVRIGTAEIYAQVELFPQVLEALCIGQDWDADVRVVLFVKLKSGEQLSDDLINAIKKQIRNGASPRHVPAKIVAVADIPRTKSGKIVELAVREVVHNRPVKNKEALANPEALDLFADLPQLKSA